MDLAAKEDPIKAMPRGRAGLKAERPKNPAYNFSDDFEGFDKPRHELDSKPAGNYCQSRRTNDQKNADDELEATLLPVGQDRNDTLAHIRPIYD